MAYYRRLRDEIRDLVNSEVREALREELMRLQVGNLYEMALERGFGRLGEGESRPATGGQGGTEQAGGRGGGGSGQAGISPGQALLAALANPRLAGTPQTAGQVGPQPGAGGPGSSPAQAGGGAQPGQFPSPQMLPGQMEMAGPLAPQVSTGDSALAGLLGQARETLVQELENNLQRLRQVISESQQIARKLEMILGEAEGGQDRGNKGGR